MAPLRQLTLLIIIGLASTDSCIAALAPVSLTIGARPSPLAQTQAQAVSEALFQATGSLVTASIVEIQARGDYTKPIAGIQSMPLAIGATDFTGSLDEALLSHDIDAAVHSLKDVPPTARWRQGLTIACHLPREAPQDVIVGPYASIQDLPQHAKVGTSSVRRQAQLLALRPDLKLINLRGNVETRLGALKDGRVDALILAQAGLNRLIKYHHHRQQQQQEQSGSVGLLERYPWHPIPSHDMLSAACQGIVAVVCRADDSETIEWMTKINDRDANIAAAAERAFLDTLDSFSPSNHYEGESPTPWVGRPPLAAFLEKTNHGECTQNQEWIFQGLLARPDGTKVLRDCLPVGGDISTAGAAKVGRELAEELLLKAGATFFTRVKIGTE